MRSPSENKFVADRRRLFLRAHVSPGSRNTAAAPSAFALGDPYKVPFPPPPPRSPRSRSPRSPHTYLFKASKL